MIDPGYCGNEIKDLPHVRILIICAITLNETLNISFNDVIILYLLSTYVSIQFNICRTCGVYVHRMEEPYSG